ncbi:PfkB family carbohydrate kinase [Plantactinospora sp. ZYX-F-223]|uniref:PfkB family carbohydrate kinase n=1 Tax=Plantactinospora sp. ZYX-F-223 TaxID=3144103 RepID=UPI0031FC26FA
MDVLVVGRANVDLTVRIPHRPTPGRTAFGSPVLTTAGGKGLNQAVAAARAGARVALLANAGADDWGRLLIRTLRQAPVELSCFQLLPSARTGVAIVEVTPDGESYVVLALSPETELTGQHVRTGFQRVSPSVVVTQLDLRPEAVDAVLREQRARLLIGNLVPHPDIGPAVFAGLDVFVANEHEAAAILGRRDDDPVVLARELRALGPRASVVTAGARGAAYASDDGTGLIDARRVSVVDTSGAGDAFLGALAARLAEGHPLPAAVTDAVTAGAMAVQVDGPDLRPAER